jgi:hypothetical protein
MLAPDGLTLAKPLSYPARAADPHIRQRRRPPRQSSSHHRRCSTSAPWLAMLPATPPGHRGTHLLKGDVSTPTSGSPIHPFGGARFDRLRRSWSRRRDHPGTATVFRAARRPRRLAQRSNRCFCPRVQPAVPRFARRGKTGSGWLRRGCRGRELHPERPSPQARVDTEVFQPAMWVQPQQGDPSRGSFRATGK